MDNKIRAETIGNRAFLWLMLTGLPLAVHDGYFDITETKTVLFIIVSMSYLVFRLVLSLQYGFTRERPTVAELFALAFATVTLVGSLTSGFFAESFLGTYGRWQGSGMCILYVALFITLRRSSWRQRDILCPLLIGLLLCGALAVGNALGWDPFGWLGALSEKDEERYISTLGNINFAGATLTLLLPPVVLRTLQSERGRERLAWSACACVGFAAAIACRSESTLLGLGAALLLLPLLLRRNESALRRWPLLFPSTILILFLLQRLGAPMSALTRGLLNPFVAGFSMALCLILRTILRKTENTGQFLRVYAYSLAAVFTLFAVGLLLVNTVLTGLPLGTLEEWLRFSPGWGTDRGRVWLACAELFRGYGPVEKLFGGGCGILARSDLQNRIFPDAVVDAAHNEYLQTLLNWGVFGVATYLGWLGTAFVSARKRGDAGLLVGLLAYAAQATVNIAQAPGIFLFFLLLPLSVCAGEENVRIPQKNAGKDTSFS